MIFVFGALSLIVFFIAPFFTVILLLTNQIFNFIAKSQKVFFRKTGMKGVISNFLRPKNICINYSAIYYAIGGYSGYYNCTDYKGSEERIRFS